MNCTSFENRLQQLLDQRDRPESDARLQAHADYCDRCRGMLDTQARLFSVIRTGEFKTADTERVPTDHWIIRLAIAAGLLLAVSLGLQRQLGPQQVGSNIQKPPEKLPAIADDKAGITTASSQQRQPDWHFLANWAQSARLPDRSPEWVNRVAGEFQPAADTVQSAFSVLRRSTLPGGEPADPGTPQASVLPGGACAVA